MPPKVERCVDDLLAKKNFKPKASAKERKSSAYAICNASIGKRKSEVFDTISSLPPDMEVTIDENGNFVLSDVDGFEFDENDVEEISEDPGYKLHFDEDASENDSPHFRSFCEVSLSTKNKKDDEEDEEDENYAENQVQIEMLREGNFKHWLYGDLQFNRKYFMSVVQNYLNDVLDRQLSFDANHEPEKGAVAWVTSLGIRRRKFKDGKRRHVLTGNAELTDWGRELLEGKRFKYFSIEVTDNFKDKESEEEFGPTALGGGVTNRPFIPGMRAIEMSEDGKDARSDSVKPVTGDAGGVNGDVQLDAGDPSQKLDDQHPKHEPQTDPKQHSDGGTNMNLEEQIKALQVRLSEMEDQKSEAAVALSEQIKVLNSAHEQVKLAQDAAKAEAEEAKAELKKELDELRARDEENAKRFAELEEKNRKADVKVFCDNLVHKDKHVPAVVKVVREVLMADSQHTVTLSEDGKDKAFDMKAIMQRVLDAIPEANRVDMSENTQTGGTDEADQGKDQPKPNVIKASDGEVDVMSDDIIKKSINRAGLKSVQ